MNIISPILHVYNVLNIIRLIYIIFINFINKIFLPINKNKLFVHGRSGFVRNIFVPGDTVQGYFLIKGIFYYCNRGGCVLTVDVA